MPEYSRKNAVRLGVLLLVLLLLMPVANSTVRYSSDGTAGRADLRQTATNVTFISTQGRAVHVDRHAGSLVAVHTDTKQVIWRHDEYRRYMDVDPIDDDRILFVAGQRYENGTGPRLAVVMNWRTGEELETFRVPGDTHDVDYLGNDRYVVADKARPRPPQRRGGRVYVYDATTGESVSTDAIVWEYVFIEHFPPYPEAGGRESGYTHLNDVDSIDNGTAFLVSPRNFDRVMAIDRSTHEVRWTLGGEDDYDVLHEQHNPVLLESDPPTVLVADSENDRVIEYRRSGSGWAPVWAYSANLSWPRDADRLPTGNTLITDSANDRVIEVTPDRRIVWAFHIERNPYDAERLRYGDEPKGPPMWDYRSEFDEAVPARQTPKGGSNVVQSLDAAYGELYRTVGAWILPLGTGRSEFVWVVLATLLGAGWLVVETALRFPASWLRDRVPAGSVERTMTPLGSTLSLLIGVGLLARLSASNDLTAVYLAVGTSLLNLGTVLGARATENERWRTHRRDTVVLVAKVGLSMASVLVAAAIAVTQLVDPSHPLLVIGLVSVVTSSAICLWTEP